MSPEYSFDPRKDQDQTPKRNIAFEGNISDLPESLTLSLEPGYVIHNPEIIIDLGEGDLPSHKGAVKVSLIFQYLAELPEEHVEYGWEYGQEKPFRLSIAYYRKGNDFMSANNLPCSIGDDICLGDRWDDSMEIPYRQAEAQPLLKIESFDPESRSLVLTRAA